MNTLLILAIAFILILVSNSPANARWINLGKGKILKACYVEDDVTDRGSYCTINVKKVPRGHCETENGEKYVTSILQCAFPLQEVFGMKIFDTDRLAIIAGTFYDEDDNVVDTFDENGFIIDWEFVQPGTYGETVSDIAEMIYNRKYLNG